jgi:hypothetical protein
MQFMETTINGVRFTVDVWPTLLGGLLVGAAIILAWRSRSGTRSSDPEAVPDLRGSGSTLRVITVALGTLLLIAMVPPACSGGLGHLGKTDPKFIDEILFPILAIDWLIVVGGALVLVQPARNAQGARLARVLSPALALLGALLALGSGWSMRLAKWHPEFALHTCTAIQKGHVCTLQARAPKSWHTIGAQEFKYDKPGDYEVPLRLRSGIAEASGMVTIHVGQERGSPWFSPRVGDVWNFGFEKRSTSAVLFVMQNRRSVKQEEGPVIRGLRELEAHGRRWLQLEVETRERDQDGKLIVKKEHSWSYFWNGETFVLPDQDGAPKWWAKDALQRAIGRPDLEPEPEDRDARQARERTLARIPETRDGLSAVTVPCVFTLFDLSCRCAERGIDAKRSLPGPVLCYAGSSGLRTIGLLLLTAFTVLDSDSTMLLQTESGNQAGLQPPQPPLTSIPTQEEFELSQAEAEAAKPPDVERQAYAEKLSSHIPNVTPIRYCVDEYARRRHGSVAFSSLLDAKGKVRAVTVKELTPAIPKLKECFEKVVRDYDFGPPPHGGMRIESAVKF